VKTINFSHDWNHKILGEQKVFSTIRKYEEFKHSYYGKSIGETFEVRLDGKKVGEAKLVDVAIMPYGLINEYPLLMVDTGYTDIDKINKLFKSFGIGPDDLCIVLVFEKIIG
jgi:hypothetical protein